MADGDIIQEAPLAPWKGKHCGGNNAPESQSAGLCTRVRVVLVTIQQETCSDTRFTKGEAEVQRGRVIRPQMPAGIQLLCSLIEPPHLIGTGGGRWWGPGSHRGFCGVPDLTGHLMPKNGSYRDPTFWNT